MYTNAACQGPRRSLLMVNDVMPYHVSTFVAEDVLVVWASIPAVGAKHHCIYKESAASQKKRISPY